MANIKRYDPKWASHMPVTAKIMEISEGPVLELGIGAFSTPLLHMLCFNEDRKLVSYEQDLNYYTMHANFNTKDHKINLVGKDDWDDIRIEETPWGVVFVDHGADRRSIEARRVADIARFVILHDSDPKNDKYYHYPEIYPLFKYRLDYTKAFPSTTVLSNFIDVSKIKI